MIEATLPFPRQQDLLVLFGTKDQNLRLLRDQLRVNVTHGDGSLVVRGDEPTRPGRHVLRGTCLRGPGCRRRR